jgi:hypothetical protein
VQNGIVFQSLRIDDLADVNQHLLCSGFDQYLEIIAAEYIGDDQQRPLKVS